MKILIHFDFGSFKQDELFQEAKFIATIFMHSPGLAWHWTTERLTQFLFTGEIHLLK